MIELFNCLFSFCSDQGWDIYPTPPNDKAKYPFVVIDNVENIPQNLKTKVFGRCSITIHVWGNEDMRLEVNNILDKLTNLNVLKTDHYSFQNRFNEDQSQILNDTSVESTDLIHGIQTLVFDWSRKD